MRWIAALYVGLWIFVLGLGRCDQTERAPHGAVVVAIEAAPRQPDPRFATSDYDGKLSRLLFAGLTTIDTPDGRPVPDLAAEVEQLSPVRWRATLRPGIQFHDGTPLTSADVVATFRSMRDPAVGSPFAADWQNVTVTAHGPLVVEFALEQPDASFAQKLELGILPAAQAALPAGVAAWIGAGPFRFVSQEAAEVRLAANPRWIHGRVGPQHVVLRVLPDDNTRLLALLGGSVTLVQNALPQTLLPAVSRQGLSVETSGSFKTSYVLFNLNHPVLQRVEVRRAIAMSIDRERLLRTRFGGAADLATGLLPRHHWAWVDAGQPVYDPAEARRLLDQAGLVVRDASGCRAQLTWKTSSNRFYRALAQAMAAELAEVGLCVRVLAYEWATFFHDVRTGNFEMASLQWTSVVDPSLLEWVYHSRNIPSATRAAGGNRGGYRNDQVDAWLDEARTTPDATARLAAVHAVQQQVAQDLPVWMLWHEHNVVVHPPQWQGYVAAPNARFRGLVGLCQGTGCALLPQGWR